MALIPKLVGVWFVEEQRLQATGLGTLSIFFGLGLAFLLVPLTADGSIHASLWIDVAVFCMVLLATIAGVPRDPSGSIDPGIDASSIATPRSWLADLGSLLRNRGFVVILLLSFFANGYSNALFTWLQPMLQPQDIDATHAGIAGLLILAGGIIGMAAVSRLREIDQRLRPLLLAVTFAGVPLTFLLLSARGFGWVMAASFLIGALLLSPLPVLVDVISRISGRRLGGTAVSGFWLVGNAGAAACIALMSWFADLQRWSIATTALAAMLLINFLIAALLLRPLRYGNIERSGP
jgi:predicted MFS family arabinose efflux permease